MNKKTRMSFLSLGFIVVILACSINNIEISETPNYELTITAQAQVLQNGAQQQAPAQAPAVVNPPAAAVVNSATPGTSPAANASTTPTTVTVKVSVETNCRQGPSVNFPSVYSMSVSDVAEVIGKNTFTNYWIIKIPGSGSTCWLWGQYATVSGNTANLIEFATPTPKVAATATKTATATITSSPVPVLTKPNAPSGLAGSYSCSPSALPNQFDYVVSLTWVDNSNNENNFNIFTNSTLFPMNANTTSFNFTQTYPAGTTLTVSVTAQNNAGSSTASTTTFVCP